MTDPIDAYAQLAERVKERFGDNWQIVYEPEYDDEASVRTEDSSRGLYTEVFVTSQTGGDDPLEVAGFLASAIDHVPALVAEVRRLRSAAEPAPLAELTEARCPSCDHLTEGHTEDGCWYFVDNVEVDADRMCPCTLSHGKPATTPEDPR